MLITEVRVRLMSPRVGPSGRLNDHLLAYASITIDDTMCVRDLRVVRNDDGRVFLAMPSREIEDHCSQCGVGTSLKDRFCKSCGDRLAVNRGVPDPETGKIKLYSDVAHPISAEARQLVEDAVLAAYEEALAEAESAAPAETPGPLAGRIRALPTGRVA